MINVRYLTGPFLFRFPNSNLLQEDADVLRKTTAHATAQGLRTDRLANCILLHVSSAGIDATSLFWSTTLGMQKSVFDSQTKSTNASIVAVPCGHESVLRSHELTSADVRHS